MISRPSTFIFVFIVLLSTWGSLAQNIYGYVYDTSRDNPLPGATVYLNGTTIGALSDADGRFLISTKREIKASLVVSYVGYTTVAVNNPYRGEVLEIILKPAIDALEEVIVRTGTDNWSREKKMKEFKRQFLGKTRAGELCVILNEDDIDLWFQKENETLKASCDVPIRIRNNLLGYDIEYHLTEFEAKYDTPDREIPYCRYAYYEGWSFYKDITQNRAVLSRFERSRTDQYFGSVTHFMRALVSDQLEEEGFDLYNGILPIAQKRVFSVQAVGNAFAVLMKKNFYLEYKKRDRSLVVKDDNEVPLLVYPDGNFTPPKSLRFDGQLADDRIGNTLPLDYDPGS